MRELSEETKSIIEWMKEAFLDLAEDPSNYSNRNDLYRQLIITNEARYANTKGKLEKRIQKYKDVYRNNVRKMIEDNTWEWESIEHVKVLELLNIPVAPSNMETLQNESEVDNDESVVSMKYDDLKIGGSFDEKNVQKTLQSPNVTSFSPLMNMDSNSVNEFEAGSAHLDGVKKQFDEIVEIKILVNDKPTLVKLNLQVIAEKRAVIQITGLSFRGESLWEKKTDENNQFTNNNNLKTRFTPSTTTPSPAQKDAPEDVNRETDSKRSSALLKKYGNPPSFNISSSYSSKELIDEEEGTAENENIFNYCFETKIRDELMMTPVNDMMASEWNSDETGTPFRGPTFSPELGLKKYHEDVQLKLIINRKRVHVNLKLILEAREYPDIEVIEFSFGGFKIWEKSPLEWDVSSINGGEGGEHDSDSINRTCIY